MIHDFECKDLLLKIDGDLDYALAHMHGALEKSKIPFENARNDIETQVSFCSSAEYSF